MLYKPYEIPEAQKCQVHSTIIVNNNYIIVNNNFSEYIINLCVFRFLGHPEKEMQIVPRWQSLAGFDVKRSVP